MSFLDKLKDKINNHLIPGWTKAYKFLSVQAGAIFSTAVLVWITLPEDQKGNILSLIGINGPSWLALAGFVAVVYARLKSQGGISNPPQQ